MACRQNDPRNALPVPPEDLDFDPGDIPVQDQTSIVTALMQDHSENVDMVGWSLQLLIPFLSENHHLVSAFSGAVDQVNVSRALS